MIATISKSNISGKVSIPSSKSFAHRLLIASALSSQNKIVKNVGNSDDVNATIDSLNSLGASIVLKENDAYVTPIKTPNINCDMNVGESGSTYRFMIPLAYGLGVNATFFTKGRLKERPNDELLKVLHEHIKDGTLQGGLYEIDASISSQYITGLMLTLPLLKKDSTILLKNEVVSKGYLDITEEVLHRSKIYFDKLNNGYHIFANQSYNIDDSIVEGDFSSAAFILVLGSFSPCGIEIYGLNNNSVQGDRVIIDILRESGVNISYKKNCLFVNKGENYKPLNVNLENAPDLCPVLAVFASKIRGTSVIRGIERLRIKESDRIKGVLDMLHSANVNATYIDKKLIIHGGNPKNSNFNGYKDHRIVMSCVILSMLSTNDCVSTVNDAECVAKSYPEFYDDIKNLGGNVICQNG